MTTEDDKGQIGPPAERPCDSCPYRRGVPSGIWDRSEYDKMRRYDAATADQPTQLWQCHQHDAADPSRRLCAGWVGCHQPHLLAIRIAPFDGRISIATAEACERYQSPVELFASGAEAADHGQRDLGAPGPRARRLIAKIARARSDLTDPESRPDGTRHHDGEV
ncbi:DUF6283 family protein [Nocardia asteroides]|uniref:DUF6283 family protein n=1 Tax=Nocardia asteroides TaxID=1824 RepID=UPI001E60FB6F|nr:DUF6283 family protein [Nocardia asteroides]UGT58806.1 DUF6283 family protein [Nocardia asteroides]